MFIRFSKTSKNVNLIYKMGDFIQYLQNIKNPNESSVREAALNYLKTNHPNKNPDAKIKNARNAISVKHLKDVTVSEYLKGNKKSKNELRDIVEKINVTSKQLMDRADFLLKNKEFFMMIMHFLIVIARIKNKNNTLSRGGSANMDQRNILVLEMVKKFVKDLSASGDTIQKGDLKTAYHNSIVENNMVTNNVIEAKFVESVMGNRQEEKISSVLKILDDKIKVLGTTLRNTKHEKEKPHVETKITHKDILTALNGTNIIAFMTLFTAFVGFMYLSFTSLSQESHSLFNESNALLKAIDTGNATEISDGCINLIGNMTKVEGNTTNVSNLCHGFLNKTDSEFREIFKKEVMSFHNGFYWSTSPLHSGAVDTSSADDMQMVIKNISDANYIVKANELSLLYDGIVEANITLNRFSSIVQATGVFMESNGTKNILHELKSHVKEIKDIHSIRKELLSEQPIISLNATTFHQEYQLPVTKEFGRFYKFLDDNLKLVSEFMSNVPETSIQNNRIMQHANIRGSQSSKIISTSTERFGSITSHLREASKYKEEKSTSSLPSNYKNEIVKTHKMAITKLLDTAVKQYTTKENLVEKVKNQNKGIKDIVTVDKFMFGIESELKNIYYMYLSQQNQNLIQNPVPESLDAVYYVRDDLNDMQANEEVQSYIGSIADPENIYELPLYSYIAESNEFQLIYQRYIFSPDNNNNVNWMKMNRVFQNELRTYHQSLTKEKGLVEHSSEFLAGNVVNALKGSFNLFTTFAQNTVVAISGTSGRSLGSSYHGFFSEAFGLDTHTTGGAIGALLLSGVTFFVAIFFGNMGFGRLPFPGLIMTIKDSVRAISTPSRPRLQSAAQVSGSIERRLSQIRALQSHRRMIPRIAQYIRDNNINVNLAVSRLNSRQRPMLTNGSAQTQAVTDDDLVNEFLQRLNDSPEQFKSWLETTPTSRGGSTRKAPQRMRKKTRSVAIMKKRVRKTTKAKKRRRRTMKS
jgi:hypothetical protein